MVLIGARSSQRAAETPTPSPDGAAEPDDSARAPEGPAGRFQRLRRHGRLLAVVAGALVVALIAVAFILGRGTASPAKPTANTKGLPAGFATYHNAADGFSISYPKAWKQVTDPNYSLLVSAGGGDALSIRVLQLQSAVNTSNVADIRAVTDAVLSTPGAKLTVLGSAPVTVAGIKGYYYVYVFPSGQDQGIHGHYFLFQGRKLIDLVFQALPRTDFAGLAPVFDQVSASLKSDPKILGPVPAPATTAPGTTAPGTTAPGATAPPP